MICLNKKELVAQYKNREQVGGVFAIRNTVLDKWLVDSAPDLAAAQNRFSFMGANFGTLAQDHRAQGGEGFAFEVLEELKKGETQTDREFRDDLAVLKAMWLDKLSDKVLY